MSSLVDHLKTPLFKDIYLYLNNQTLTKDQLIDWDEFQSIQNELNKGILKIIYPYVKDRPDIKKAYQHADLKVKIFDTIDGIRLCVNTIVVDLALDLNNEPMTLVQDETYVPMELPFV